MWFHKLYYHHDGNYWFCVKCGQQWKWCPSEPLGCLVQYLTLSHDFDVMLAQMQTPTSRAAMKAAFDKEFS